jgi:hypothetical protein
VRPGGHLLMLEHVRSPVPAVRVVQWLLEPPSVRFGADHLLREPVDYGLRRRDDARACAAGDAGAGFQWRTLCIGDASAASEEPPDGGHHLFGPFVLLVGFGADHAGVRVAVE